MTVSTVTGTTETGTTTTGVASGSETRTETVSASSPGVLLGRLIARSIDDEVRPPIAALVSTGADSCGTARRSRP